MKPFVRESLLRQRARLHRRTGNGTVGHLAPALTATDHAASDHWHHPCPQPARDQPQQFRPPRPDQPRDAQDLALAQSQRRIGQNIGARPVSEADTIKSENGLI